MPDPSRLRRAALRRDRSASDTESPDPSTTGEHHDVPGAPRHARQLRGRTVLGDFLRPSRAQAIIAVVLFFTSLLVVMGVKASSSQSTFSTMRRADLIQMLDTLNAESRRLEGEIRELQSTKQRLESGADSAKVAEAEAAKRLSQLQILAGTVPAAGPGIRLVIIDPKGKVGPELVLDAVEEMRDAGAEVIEINDSVRVVASTWFARSANGGVVAGGVELTSPITIEVIGDPATLEAGARFRGGLVSEVQSEAIGGQVLITQLDDLRIDSLHEPTAFQFAEPVR